MLGHCPVIQVPALKGGLLPPKLLLPSARRLACLLPSEPALLPDSPSESSEASEPRPRSSGSKPSETAMKLPLSLAWALLRPCMPLSMPRLARLRRLSAGAAPPLGDVREEGSSSLPPAPPMVDAGAVAGSPSGDMTSSGEPPPCVGLWEGPLSGAPGGSPSPGALPPCVGALDGSPPGAGRGGEGDSSEGGVAGGAAGVGGGLLRMPDMGFDASRIGPQKDAAPSTPTTAPGRGRWILRCAQRNSEHTPRLELASSQVSSNPTNE
mmetsp:Transcript_39720/g.88248  ORF Transcript_39720/g.88248 Transcript_39720/m.88248 type:complete len:266 (+) Transcript_39720:1651-2448(+)